MAACLEFCSDVLTFAHVSIDGIRCAPRITCATISNKAALDTQLCTNLNAARVNLFAALAFAEGRVT